jgi:hypothetical protein
MTTTLINNSKQMDKLTDFMHGVIREIRKFTNKKDELPFRTEDELSYNMYNRIRCVRRGFLYANRFLEKNEFAIENSSETMKKFFKIMIKKSEEFIYEIPIITLTHKFSNKKKRYFKITLKNLHKYKYIYYNRKTVVSILISNILPPMDLCRKISDYLY